MWIAVALSVVVVAYNALINRWEPFNGAAYVPTNLLFAAAVTVFAGMGLELGWAELLPVGDLAGILASVLLVALFAVGAFGIARSRHGHRIADERMAGSRGPALRYYVLVRIPLGTSVTEEVLFRGVLFAVWRDAGASDLVAALCASAAFGLWHIAPSAIALRVNDPDAPKNKVRATVVGAVLLTAVAGSGLTWLRVVSGGLAAPILLHAGINSVGALAAVVAHRAKPVRR